MDLSKKKISKITAWFFSQITKNNDFFLNNKQNTVYV